jgi:hypothetical protein
VKLFVEAYLRVMLGGTVDVLIERSLKNGVLALVLHTAVCSTIKFLGCD